jgi:lipopolysaccharide biosynthesis glycosyltransferase|tara:strand:- start:489 stop:689 length:201 start_codon:yes stop_codon:yes gene_type:complete
METTATNELSMQSMLNHMNFLFREIKILEDRFEEHDTGHLHTTVDVLKKRINEIQSEMVQLSCKCD